MAEQIKAKLDMYNRLSMRNKRLTDMTSSVTWFGSHIVFTIKPIKKIFSRTAGQIEEKLHINILQSMGVRNN